MHYCKSCAKNVVGHRPYDSQLCCDICGRVLDFDNLTTEIQFTKNAAGQSQMSGSFIRTIHSEYGASRERLLREAYEDMKMMKDALQIDYSDEIVFTARRFYDIAVSRNFTKGRRRELVQASCLYCACRQTSKPFLLIDFSQYLNINVYELGAVYLQLCHVLYLADEPDFQKLLDPSIFLPRFTNRLEANKKVCDTARDILASMKRDWMTTGRKPSGLCGAALYISALAHGFKFSKSKIVSIVHVCEATLTKRLVEFENTDSGNLTMEDFIAKKNELQEGSFFKDQNDGSKLSGTNEVLCKHKDSGKPFAYGLCKTCYDEFMTISEGLEGGSDPPAFQVAERERIAKESTEENANFERELNSPFVSRNEKVQSQEPSSIGPDTNQSEINVGVYDKSIGDDANTEASDESDNFSDIDDFEFVSQVDGYLHNEEEKHYKKIIWEEMNREYLEEQAAKEAAAAAAKEAFEANYKDCPEGLKAAQELAAAVAKSKKERQQKRAAETRNSAPASTALEATCQMLAKKRLSSKINYDVLKDLFDDSVAPEDTKKQRTESLADSDNKLPKSGNQEHKSEETLKNNLGPEVDEDDEGDAGEAYGNEMDENVDETYCYDDGDDDYYGYDAL
ncbi:hypothetical protein Dsin_021621 [Dipteronia sinensis]|uniref:Cyclin-like domain-containing protein n=1 Tax=Dipteronia sinensis TaxID=43782 RepID=A0AAE0DZ72_9ROSI|nr:hypothetical protein Dsin_021621 [Dipteronia sinensis]